MGNCEIPIRRIRQTTGSVDESFMGHEEVGRKKTVYSRTVRHETRVRLAL